MDTISLKKYIYDNQKVKLVLTEIGCHHIQYHSLKNYYSCGNYNGDNVFAVNIYNTPYLGVKNWTREKDFEEHSDIFSLIQYNKGMSFTESVKYLHSILGLDYKWVKPVKKTFVDPLAIFKTHKYGKMDVKEYEILQSDLIDHYVPILHESWFKEGILPMTREKFDICYSHKRRRIMIPLRMWNTGELLGFNSRTTIENYEELGIKKYFITPSYPKQYNLYGLYENYDEIQKVGRVIVYESEKSVLKRDSRNDHTGVALSGHTISDEQVAILKGLGVEIIISMDKDISLEEVKYLCGKFKGYNVSYTYDKYDILSPKTSIADMPNKVCETFIRNRIKAK